MYVCMHACMYVCKCVCLYEYMYVCMYVCTNGMRFTATQSKEPLLVVLDRKIKVLGERML